jgi:predicted negative regulator of RcsB-dependent stress response
MAYDLEEQEQLDQLKAWWAKYGNFILTVVTVVLLAFAAYNGWQWYQRNQAAQAAGVYGQFELALAARDADKASALALRLTEAYGRTVHAQMASLQAAKLHADAGQNQRAAEHLQWVIDRATAGEIALIARVRLAGVLLDDKRHDEALKVLEVAQPGVHAVAIHERRGDILVAQNRIDEARAAYTEALARADPQHPLRQLIQFKLDALPVAGA